MDLSNWVVSSPLLVAPKLQHPFRKSTVSIGCGMMITNNFVTATSPHDVPKLEEFSQHLHKMFGIF